MSSALGLPGEGACLPVRPRRCAHRHRERAHQGVEGDVRRLPVANAPSEREKHVRPLRCGTTTTGNTSTARSAKTGSGRFCAAVASNCPTATRTTRADAETVNGLGNRKNDMFQKVLHDDGVKVFDGSRRYLEAVSAARSGHRRRVVERQHPRRARYHRCSTGTSSSGSTASRCATSTSPGKPAPDSYLRGGRAAGRRTPAAAAVFEDALAGVASRAAPATSATSSAWTGSGQAEELRRDGADVVVTDLAELLRS